MNTEGVFAATALQFAQEDDFVIYLLHTFIFLLCGIGCVGALKLAGASFGQWEISIVWGLAVAMGKTSP